MDFKQWIENTIVEATWYHGTADADSIRKHGFKESLSGFGQRGLRGVALTHEQKDAKRYAISHYLSKDGPRPEILICKANLKNTIDLRGCDRSYDIWVKLGYDPIADKKAQKYIKSGNQNNPFFLTQHLIEAGYDSAFVDNTLALGGPWELCVFFPRNIKVIGTIPVVI